MRVVNPDWPSGEGPYCERVDYAEVLTGVRQGVALGSDETTALEVREVGREADGVQAPSVVRVSAAGKSLTISGEPQVGDTVHVACNVMGVRQDGEQRVAILEPMEVVG
jgi:hypothetical protein